MAYAGLAIVGVRATGNNRWVHPNTGSKTVSTVPRLVQDPLPDTSPETQGLVRPAGKTLLQVCGRFPHHPPDHKTKFARPAHWFAEQPGLVLGLRHHHDDVAQLHAPHGLQPTGPHQDLSPGRDV